MRVTLTSNPNDLTHKIVLESAVLASRKDADEYIRQHPSVRNMLWPPPPDPLEGMYNKEQGK